MQTSTLVLAACLVTGGLGLAGALSLHGRTTPAQEHDRALSGFREHEAKLAAQARPTRRVEDPGGARFQCVSASGWMHSAPSKDEADSLCKTAAAGASGAPRKFANAGFPTMDPSALNALPTAR